MAADNMTLGRFNLEGIPPAPRGMPQVEVTFDIDANGILKVGAQDKATGKEQRITITASTNLSQAEVEEKVQDAKRHEEKDLKRKELIQARNTADSLVYQAEKTLGELADKVPAADRTTIEQNIEDLKRAKDGDDAERIRQLIEQLQQATYAIGQQMYAQEQAGAGGPGFAQETEGFEPSGEDFVDGEFQEV
jgi:molecular chaperone DnaK